MAEKKIGVEVSDRAKAYLAEVGYDPQFGARPLKRSIQSHIQNPLAKMIIAGKIVEGSVIRVDTGKDGLKFSTRS